jgi:2,3-dihydro-2,3-dihydroxybenzoate dehydrogenase
MSIAKTALVTGATSGIGRATAQRLARDGTRVLVVGRNRARAEACVEAIVTAGGEARSLLGDVTDPEFCTTAVRTAVDAFGRLDVLTNIAGIIRRGDVPATSDENWNETMTANVDSVFFMSRAAISVMRTGGGGSIVNLASTVGLVGGAGLAAYCASKGAVIQLTRAMALDHAGEGIRVNAVCPGAVDTPMLVSEHADGVTPEAVHARNIAAIPQGRIPRAEEIAELIAFLASDASHHITGTAIPIDGGYTAR